jgi:hypothetical protein
MLDHDTRLRCQQREGLLILRGERAIAPFGQIQIAERRLPNHDRHAQERLHRRMPRREAGAARILIDRVQPQRRGVATHGAQDAAASRQVSQPASLLRRYAHGNELGKLRTGQVEHAERPVPRTGQLTPRLHDPHQHLIKPDLRPHPHPSFDHPPKQLGTPLSPNRPPRQRRPGPVPDPCRGDSVRLAHTGTPVQRRRAATHAKPPHIGHSGSAPATATP